MYGPPSLSVLEEARLDRGLELYLAVDGGDSGEAEERVSPESETHDPGDITWQGPEEAGEMLNVRWNKELQDVSTFAEKWDLPQVVKLSGGGYRELGSSAALDVHQPFLLYTARRCSKILANSIRWDQDSRQYVKIGPKIVIPLNYSGWYCFIQDRGTSDFSLRTIEAVAREKPESFLSRTPIIAYNYTKKKRTGEKVYYKVNIPAGEVFTVGDIVVESIGGTAEKNKFPCCLKFGLGSSKVNEVFYLQCTDSSRKELLLPFDAIGQFDRVGAVGVRENEVVFQLNDIARSVDLPVQMKLVFGDPPAVDCQFTNLLRFEELYFEESLIACTLFDDKITMLEFPTDSEIQFIRASNWDDIKESCVVKSAITYCDENIYVYNTGMKILQSVFPSDSDKDESSNVNSLDKISSQPADDNQNNIDYNKNDEFCQEILLNPRVEQKSAVSGEDNTGDACAILNEDEAAKRRDMSRSSLRENSIQGRDLPVPPLPPRNSSQDLGLLDEETDSSQVVTIIRPNTPQTVLSDDPDYETIPYFKKAVVKVNDSVQTPTRMLAVDFRRASLSSPAPGPPAPNLPERDFPIVDQHDKHTVHDDEGYLAPVEIRKQLNSQRSCVFCGPNLSNHDLSCTSDYANSSQFLQVPPQAGSRPNTSVSGGRVSWRSARPPLERAVSVDYSSPYSINTKQIWPIGLAHHQSIGSNLSVYDEDRLHAFLSDTLDELQRRQSKQSVSGSATTLEAASSRSEATSRSSVKPKVTEPPETVEELDEFLDQIFDVDEEGSSGKDDRTVTSIVEGMSKTLKSRGTNGYLGTGEPRSLFIRQESGRTDSGIMINPNSNSSDVKPESDSVYRSFSDCSWTPPDDISGLSVEEVALCLRYIGMKERVVLRFCEEQIDGKQLVDLDVALLEEGFPELNALERKKVCDFVSGWRPKRWATDC